jgi:hypothetical protein
MKWTPAKPTLPGWYWWRTNTVITRRWVLQGIIHIDGDGYCRHEGEYVSKLDGQWAGPIPSPEEAQP